MLLNIHLSSWCWKITQFPLSDACFVLFFMLISNIWICEVWFFSDLKARDSLKVTKVYLLVKLRFSSKVWFQQSPVVFHCAIVNQLKDSSPWVLFQWAAWSHYICWSGNTQVKNDMSKRSKNVPQEFLISPWPPLHLLCILRNIVELVKVQLRDGKEKKSRSWVKNQGNGG